MQKAHYMMPTLLLGSLTVVVPQQVKGQQGDLVAVADTDTRALVARLDELDQQIRILRRLRELAADSTAAAARLRPSIAAEEREGLRIQSADGKYAVRLRGYLQSDGRLFLGDHDAIVSDNFLIRRARPVFDVIVGRYFGFRLMPDFGGPTPTIFDAYWEGRLAPALTVRAGKFKPAVGLERLQSATDMLFAERGLPTNLVPNRDIGLQIGGELGRGAFTYQAGVFDGVPDFANGGDDIGDAKDFTLRLFVQPLSRRSAHLLGVGVAASTGLEHGLPASTALPQYRTPGQQVFFRYRTDVTTPANTVVADGRRSRLSPQGYFYSGPFGLLGEFVVSRQDVARGVTAARLEHTSWQASGSYFLTGEHAGFRSPMPKRAFDLGARGYGALELIARYGRLTIDDAAFPIFANLANSARRVDAWAVGMNWHLTAGVRIAVNYEHASFLGGAATGNREVEHVVITRFQHAF